MVYVTLLHTVRFGNIDGCEPGLSSVYSKTGPRCKESAFSVQSLESGDCF